MKKLLLVFLLGFTSVSAQLSDVSVTFSFDATPLITNCMLEPTNGGTLNISGSINGWGAGEAMTKNSANNTYTIVKTLKKKAAGDTVYSYKLRPKANTSALMGWENDPNRSLTLTPSSTTQIVDLGAYQGSVSNQCAPTDNVEVTFKVDMGAQIAAGNFIAATDTVKVAGDFTDWGTGAKKMLRVGTSNRYAVTHQFTGIKVGVPQQLFKFIHKRGTAVTWEADPNKSITVPATGLIDLEPNGFKNYTLLYVFDSSAPPTAADAEELPQGANLSAAYPNPFSQQAQVSYELSEAGEISLKIYDLMGREVALVQPKTYQSAGTYTLSIDASQLASGTYLLHLAGEKGQITQRLTIVK